MITHTPPNTLHPSRDMAAAQPQMRPVKDFKKTIDTMWVIWHHIIPHFSGHEEFDNIIGAFADLSPFAAKLVANFVERTIAYNKQVETICAYASVALLKAYVDHGGSTVVMSTERTSSIFIKLCKRNNKNGVKWFRKSFSTRFEQRFVNNAFREVVMNGNLKMAKWLRGWTVESFQVYQKDFTVDQKDLACILERGYLDVYAWLALLSALPDIAILVTFYKFIMRGDFRRAEWLDCTYDVIRCHKMLVSRDSVPISTYLECIIEEKSQRILNWMKGRYSKNKFMAILKCVPDIGKLRMTAIKNDSDFFYAMISNCTGVAGDAFFVDGLHAGKRNITNSVHEHYCTLVHDTLNSQEVVKLLVCTPLTEYTWWMTHTQCNVCKVTFLAHLRTVEIAHAIPRRIDIAGGAKPVSIDSIAKATKNIDAALIRVVVDTLVANGYVLTRDGRNFYIDCKCAACSK